MKNVEITKFVEDVITKYPHHKYGSACAIFDNITNICTNKLESDKSFKELIDGLFDLGFDDVHLSISLDLDCGTLNFNQCILKGGVDD